MSRRHNNNGEITMTKQQDTVNEVVEQGKSLIQKANTRHIIIRKQNGEKVVDVTFGVAAVIALLLLWVQPFGIFLVIAGIAYSFYAKLKLELVHEVGSSNNVVEMRMPNEDDYE
jgi:hypothetical protein